MMLLLTCLSAAVTLPFLIAIAIALISYARIERSSLEREGVLANAELTSRVEDALRQKQRRIQSMAQSPWLNDTTGLETFRQKLKVLDQDLDIALVETATGRVAAALDNSLVPALSEKALAALVRPERAAQLVPALDLMEPRPGTFAVPLVAPVNRGGASRYTLVALLPATIMADVMSGAHVLPPFSASLVDAKGRIIARTDPKAQLTGQIHPLAAEPIRDSGIRSGRNPYGIEAISFYKRSPFTGWIVSSSVAVDALVAPLHRSLWLIGSLVLLLVALSSVLAYVITLRLARTTKGLIEAARALGQREPVDAAELPLHEGNLILGALSAASLALDEQDRALRHANETLELRVQERTQKLNEALQQAEAAEMKARKAGDELARLAKTDALTALANRRSFDEAIAHHIAWFAIEPAPLSLLVIDADHFKRINDEHGHDIGDAVLQALAALLAEQLRSSTDVLFRIGGEEFAVLLPSTSQAAAMAIAVRLHAAIDTMQIDATPIAAGSITISIGLATLEPGQRADAGELYRAADRALYKAKNSGRNRTETGYIVVESLAAAG